MLALVIAGLGVLFAVAAAQLARTLARARSAWPPRRGPLVDAGDAGPYRSTLVETLAPGAPPVIVRCAAAGALGLGMAGFLWAVVALAFAIRLEAFVPVAHVAGYYPTVSTALVAAAVLVWAAPSWVLRAPDARARAGCAVASLVVLGLWSIAAHEALFVAGAASLPRLHAEALALMAYPFGGLVLAIVILFAMPSLPATERTRI